jgi:hypothetical protein
MSKTQPFTDADARERVVRKLFGMFALSVVIQAALFLALAALYRLAARFALDTIANASHGSPPAGADATAALIVLVLELFTALVIGFFAGRRLLSAVVRATPHPMKPPTRPIPLASLYAGGIVAVISVLDFARQPLLGQSWPAWVVELVRDIGIAVLFWYAAARSMTARKAS